MSTPLSSDSGRYVVFSILINFLATFNFRKPVESITIDRSLKKKVSQCHFLDDDTLLEADTLSDIFPDPEPKKETLHIVVWSLRIGGCPLFVP